MAVQHSDSYLSYNIKLMKTISLWSLETKSPFILTLNTIYTVFLVTSLSVVSVGQVVEIFVSPNISSMASAVDFMTLTTSALFKMIYIKWYQRLYQDLVMKMDSTFVPSDFTGKKFLMTNWLKRAKFCTNSYILMSPVGFVTLFGVMPYLFEHYFSFESLPSKETNVVSTEKILFIDSPYKTENKNQTHNMSLNYSQFNTNLQKGIIENEDFATDTKRIFPFNCWFPVDVTWSPLYEVVYVWEVFFLVNAGLLYLITDTFFFMIIYVICGQLEILKVNLRSIPGLPSSLSDSSSFKNNNTSRTSSVVWPFDSGKKELDYKMNDAMSKCVHFHNDILSVIRDLDRLLRALIVADFLHAVTSLSFAMLQTVTSNTAYQWINMIVFITICILHQFCNNLFADILNQQQMSVAEAAYNTPWVDSSTKFKAAVRLIVAQTRCPTRISGWKMYVLGLGTFVEFMKLLSSYFLVLQSLHAEESSS